VARGNFTPTLLLKENKALKVPKQERRAFTRKKVVLPAFVYENGAKKTEALETGTIMDISLGGLLICVPKESKLEISTGNETNEFHIIFTLPESQRTINMVFRPQRIAESEEAVQVGAAFVDSDFQSCQTLHKYLI
jgi:c-di-GMP-binding flagellar brake protein YcgR